MNSNSVYYILVAIVVILCAGDPDLLDAIRDRVAGYPMTARVQK